jgi:hypothetical protein
MTAECKTWTWSGTQQVFSDLSQQSPECISVPVLNVLRTEYSYFEYGEGSGTVCSLHTDSNWTYVMVCRGVPFVGHIWLGFYFDLCTETEPVSRMGICNQNEMTGSVQFVWQFSNSVFSQNCGVRSQWCQLNLTSVGYGLKTEAASHCAVTLLCFTDGRQSGGTSDNSTWL